MPGPSIPTSKLETDATARNRQALILACLHLLLIKQSQTLLQREENRSEKKREI